MILPIGAYNENERTNRDTELNGEKESKNSYDVWLPLRLCGVSLE